MTKSNDVAAALHGLATDGFHIVTNARPVPEVQDARATLTPLLEESPFGRNGFVGVRTKRIHSIFGRTRCVDDLVSPHLDAIPGRPD